MNEGDRLLVIGYGNPARGDDALGPLLAARVEALELPGVTVEDPMQLNLEDAATVAGHDAVLFIDATRAAEAVTFEPLEPGGTVAFTSHTLAPGAVLALARDHFDATPAAWLLAVRGEDFELGAPLSPEGAANLEAAWETLHAWLRQRPAAPILL